MLKHTSADILLACVVLSVVGMMIIPLPTPLLDVLVAANIAVAVLLMLVAMYIRSGLELSAFPTILLVTTLYRLALNVSSTRLILLQADAGDVIAAFGDFVVRGNYVVGGVVFLILTLIQFLVIAKGSERVAEVGARFALDAMPGKQMSIDAELRSGALSQEEARAKRHQIQRESQFYGAMDGAMKFVKGDAIAGIVITVVNVLGGLLIGVMQRDMSAAEALRTYSLLTIGDGLVSQIPALLISTAAGLVVTRVASEDADASLGADVAAQVFGHPRPLLIGAAFLALIGVVPGLPTLPFFVLAGTFFAAGHSLQRRQRVPVSVEAIHIERESARETRARAAMVPIVVPIAIELGSELAQQITDGAGGGELLEEHVPAVRDALFLDLGLAVPGVRVRESPTLDPQGFVVSVQEVPVVRGEIPAGHVLALDSSAALEALGLLSLPAVDPLGSTACWVDASQAHLAEDAGVSVLPAAAFVARALHVSVARRATELLGLQEVQSMLEQLERAYPAVVRNVTPKPVSLPLLTEVLRRLVEERVSIRPLREILEALSVHAAAERDPVQLTELVRASLRRQLTHRHAPGGTLAVYTVDGMIEDSVRDAIQRTAGGTYLALPPDQARDIIEAARRTLAPLAAGRQVVLTQRDVRRFLRRLLEVELPDVTVLSYQELAPEVNVQPLGQLGVAGLRG
ncbi:MAG: type III secretion system export apparatus subunit SctV [Myxococcales bacterium]|nr:type III secretion system export apparatus subunit SctV [Myxococcales bacterium]